LFFSALEGPGGALGNWQAAYLDPGTVDRERAEAMSSVLSRLDAAPGGRSRPGGTAAGFAGYLADAAQVLGIGGALPFCARLPGRAGTAWWRGNETGLGAWLGAELGAYRERPAGGISRPAGLFPDVGHAVAATRRDSAAGEALERLLSAWPAEEFTPETLQRLVRSAGELWDSTSGHDPHDVLSAPQREALDLAAAVYRDRLNREMGEPGLDLPPGHDW